MFGVAVAFAPNFTVYVILRFVVGATISGVIINAFVLGTNKTQIHTEKQAMMSCDSSYSSSCTMMYNALERWIVTDAIVLCRCMLQSEEI